jgi:cellulose synthase/poly-beta-1,6-N-acetylglucosamine synthase-like glycosyltransferase
MIGAIAVTLLTLTSAVLFAYGANLLYLAWQAARLTPSRPGRLLAGDEPLVAVQIPIYNERYVAQRVIDAVAALDWPADRIEVQVLDDSDDDTVEIVAARVALWRSHGLRIEQVRRAGRSGYKAGALAHGLALTDAPLVAIFDADFVPPADFLRRTIPPFADPGVGFVQARWGHLNESYSWLTRVQAMTIDFHFLVEQPVRAALGFFTNFTGTAGVWRRAAIEAAGGWSDATLTEDLDLSYRAQLKGWRAAYLEDLQVPQELPVSLTAYRRQQARWATGSFQCARALVLPVLRAALPAGVKWQAIVHLCSYSVPLLVLVQVACYPLLLSGHLGGSRFGATAIPFFLNFMSLAPLIAFTVAQRRLGRPWWQGSVALVCQLVGAGLSVTIARALVRAFRRGGEFQRTPKYRIEARGQEWRRGVYGFGGDRFALVELAFGITAGSLAAGEAVVGQLLMAAYSALVMVGLLYMAGTGLAQSIDLGRPVVEPTAEGTG